MRIRRQEVFAVNGQTFTTEDKAREHIQDVLGEAVDKLLLHNILLGPGDRIKLVESMMKHSAEIVRILDGCLKPPAEDWED